MPQSHKLHQSIQKAGAAVSASAASLLAMAESHGLVVASAMRSNPTAKENDGLLSHWKLLSLLANELGAMDARLRELYHGMPGMAAAAKNSVMQAVAQVGAEAKPKRGRKPGTKLEPAAKPTAKVKSKAKAAAKANSSRKPKAPRALKGNDAKVLAYLDTVLGENAFTTVRHNDVASGAGIPVGSVARALAQLAKRGLIAQGSKGEFKRLAATPVAAAPVAVAAA